MDNKYTQYLGFLLAFVAGGVLMWGVANKDKKGSDISADNAAANATPANVKLKPGAVDAHMYVMSQCPYGTRAVDGMIEAVKQLPGDVNLHMDFIGQTQGDKLTSMHGPNEVKGDIAQLCAAKIAPNKYLNMISCQNKNARKVAENWNECGKKAGIDVAKLGKCINGKEGKDLLRASFARSKAKRATGSPTIYIGGKRYQGKRSGNAFLRALCGAHSKSNTPKACAAIPPIPEVNVFVVSDKRCSDCNANRYMGFLHSRLGKPVIKTLDVSDAQGKKIYDAIGGGNLPVIVFDKSIEKDKDAMQGLARHLKNKGDYRVMNVGGKWNPKCAGEGACELDECKNTMACRKETPKTLEVFVMSQCPYGVRALNAMKEVLDTFGSQIDFKVHYIANGNASDGFKSMHGQGEVDEDLREVCAMKHYGKKYKYMDYILCRNKNIRSNDWESCATGGIDKAKIKKCFEGKEGKALLENDIKVANSLGIGASPTWVVNGKNKFSGIDADTVRKNLCKYNPKLTGCDKKLSGPAHGGPVGGCGK